MSKLKFYRYRPLTIRDFEGLCDGSLFYADPSRFNDPLDCSPTIEVDININDLKLLFRTMVERNDGPQKAFQRYQDIEYNLTDPEISNLPQYTIDTYAREILAILKSYMSDFRVLSLSERNDSVLMWSHYAHNHQGMCVEYSISQEDFVKTGIKQVKYANGRAIPASTLYKWLMLNDEDAGKEAIHKCFFVKSEEWEYEKEWRDVDKKDGGTHRPTLLDITAIYFGMNCPNHAEIATIKLMHNRNNSIKFYRMSTLDNGFALKPQMSPVDEIVGTFPRQSPLLVFKPIKP